MESLKIAYLSVLGFDNELRKQAETHLKSIENSNGFLITNLQLVAMNPSTVQEVAVRLSAAVHFKNIIKKKWIPLDDLETSIDPQDKEDIKTHLISLMCSTPPDIQKQLAEVVSVVAKHDFPTNWESLLPQLIEKLNCNDFRIIQGVMLTANSIFKKFRFIFKTEELMSQLSYCLNLFQCPLLETFKYAGNILNSITNDKEALLLVLETLRLMSRIFFSLNWQDLPEYFEDNISVWMSEFAKYLSYQNPLLLDIQEEHEPGPVETMQAAIVENLSLYVTKYEEEFAPHLPLFTQLVWTLLTEVSAASKYDNLATQSMKFLICISSKRVNSLLFSDEVVQNIIEHIVLCNLTASEADEELFHDNPMDYIRKDVEGGDQETRRRCATELLRALMKFSPVATSGLCLNYIESLLSRYATSRDWKAKDTALHLVLAVSASSSSVAQGVGEVNSRINIIEIFTTHIIPELQDQAVNTRPIMKTDSMKMLCLFRHHLDTCMLLMLIPDIIRHLQSIHVVIHTYAALTLEKLMCLKLKGVKGARISREDLAPNLQQLLEGLFAILDNPHLPENEQVMKCLMRVLVVMGASISSVTSLVLFKLMQSLERVSKNPANPRFNHYLFECFAILIRSCCVTSDTNAAIVACTQFESLLFPPFQSILSQDIVEFSPYVFQLLASLLSYRPLPGLSEPYKALLKPLMFPMLWERKGNAPALTELIVACIHKGMQDIETANCLQPLLGVFQKLLSSKNTEKLAFKILLALFASKSVAALTPYVSVIWNLLLTKLQDTKNTGYPRAFFLCLTVFCIHYGPESTSEVLEGVSRGIVVTLITQVWSPQSVAIANASDDVERRVMIVGATKLLCESTIITQSAAWGHLLKAIIALLNAKTVDKSDLPHIDDETEDRSFDSVYSELHYCQLPETNHVATCTQTDEYLASSLAVLCRNHPSKYLSVIQSALNAEESKVLQDAMSRTHLMLV